MKTILIVEDDSQIRNFIGYILKQEGFSYRVASTAKEALSIVGLESIGLILLDLGLPDRDGIEVIQEIRTWSSVPIIVISARDKDQDKVTALDIGADDYLTKPFSAVELLARIRVELRHVKQYEKKVEEPILSVGDLSIDLEKRKVMLANSPLHVTPLEYSLLSLFFKNLGKVLTTQYIIKEIYGSSYGSDTQALRTLMAGLRRKIEPTPARPRYILTEIGVGYRMVDE